MTINRSEQHAILDRASARLSADGVYRYTLTREWWTDRRPTSVTFVMLNPSTADATQDDPTVRRCIGYARAWGHSRLTVVNLYPLRATRPEDLLTHPNPHGHGDDNQIWINRSTITADVVVFAWGAFLDRMLDASRSPRVDVSTLAGMADPAYCLGVTASGQPRHPLYLPRTATPKPWEP